MRTRTFFGLIAGGVCLSATPLLCADTRLTDADALFEKRSDPVASQQALALYDALITEDTQKSTDLQWKAARAAWWWGTTLKNKDEKIKLFERGIEYGKTAVERAPDSVESQFWLGANYASYGHDKGAFTSLGLISKIRATMESVDKIDEKYQSGGGHRILGILDYSVPGIMGGNKKRALDHLQRALALDPEHPVTRFYIADFYASTGEKDKARAALKELDALKIPARLEPEGKLIEPERKALAKRLGL